MSVATDPTPIAAPTRRRDRRRKLRAVLAAGLVLGVGGAVTLAAWNDSEFATSTFTAGSFNLEGAEGAGTTFTQHATAGAAAPLTFTTPFSNMAPGDAVYAPFAVRLAATTTTDASVTLASATPGGTGLATNFAYGAALVAAPGPAGCTSATFSGGTIVVPDNTAISAVTGAVPFTLAKGTPVASAGVAKYLCFKVTAGANLVQGQSNTATWEIKATSTT